MLTSRGVDWQEATDLREVAADVDVLYQTRIQKERFTNLEDYAQVLRFKRRLLCLSWLLTAEAHQDGYQYLII
jgi:aspartate carbamoyltransferase catalytic subunit